MKFSDMKYERPDMDSIIKEMTDMLDQLQKCPDATSFMQVFKEINTLRSHLQTVTILAEIRHTINTADEFYSQEKEYWDETMPKWQGYEDRFKSIVLDANDQDDLKKYIPETFFKIAEIGRASCRERV